MTRRLITSLPVTELRDDSGPVHAVRGQRLSTSEIDSILAESPVRFVFAEIGEPMTWVPPHQAAAYYRSEILPHLIEPPLPPAADMPGGYGYIASLWDVEAETPVILLELHRTRKPADDRTPP